MIKRNVFYQRNIFIYFMAMITSFFLSFWISIHEVIINPDAICYLSGAEIIGTQGLQGAMALCGQAKWPFYSLLIYGVVQITHLSYISAAYILNSLFSALSVMMFIAIIKELGGSRRVMWFAAGVILLSHQFNNVREYIIRDHGFWAFYLVSIFYLLRFFRQPSSTIIDTRERLFTACGWSISLFIAALFRIEGFIFLVLLPFLTWFLVSLSWRVRANYFLMLNIPLLILLIGGGSWLFMHPAASIEKLGRLPEFLQQFQHGFSMMAERYLATKTALAEHVLTPDSAKHAGMILILIFLSWYVLSIVNALSWTYSALVIYAWWRRAAIWAASARLVIYGYLGINFVVTFIFLFERLFLSKRYLIAFILTFMLWVPFAIEKLIQRGSQKQYRTWRQRLFIVIVLLCIFISGISGILNFGYSKKYLIDAGNWLAQNVPANKTLYVNDYQLMYYSKHFNNILFEKSPDYDNIQTLAHGQWRQYDYVAIRINKNKQKKMHRIVQEIPFTPIYIFSNERGDRVVIYQITLQKKEKRK